MTQLKNQTSASREVQLAGGKPRPTAHGKAAIVAACQGVVNLDPDELEITGGIKKEICTVLAFGGSMTDAAGYLRISRAAISSVIRRDEQFRLAVRSARKHGKLALIQKVGKAPAWQAATWLLERKYAAEFGKNRNPHPRDLKKQLNEIKFDGDKQVIDP